MSLDFFPQIQGGQQITSENTLRASLNMWEITLLNG